MDIKFEDETPWRFELGCFLTERSITYTDVTEVIMLVKEDPTDADGDALVTKKFSLSEITFPNADQISVTIDDSDYGAGAMEIGGTYNVYIGFTAPGYTDAYLEAALRDQSVTIVQDGIRD